MNESLTILPGRSENKRWGKKLLGGLVTAAAAVAVAVLAIPAGLLLCLACLIWSLADRILDALDR